MPGQIPTLKGKRSISQTPKIRAAKEAEEAKAAAKLERERKKEEREKKRAAQKGAEIVGETKKPARGRGKVPPAAEIQRGPRPLPRPIGKKKT